MVLDNWLFTQKNKTGPLSYITHKNLNGLKDTV